MKLPLLNDYGCTDHYLEQLIAEHYLNGLLEGYTLKFMTTRLVKYLGNLPYLKMNERLMSIPITMSDVIERRELDLNFEFAYAGGLLLHNYTENEECDQHEDIVIGLRINGFKIECINYRLPTRTKGWCCAKATSVAIVNKKRKSPIGLLGEF